MAIEPQNIWKPQFLRALGAGFTNDGTVNDGIHLRWTSAPNLGIPFRHNNVQKGNYKVEQLKSYNRVGAANAEIIPIRNVSLFNNVPLELQPFVKAQNDVILNPQIGSEETPREGYFFKKVIENYEYRGLFKFFNSYQTLKSNTIDIDIEPKDQHFLDYLYEIHDTMRPETINAFNQEICETVAVDMSFNFLNDLAPGAAPLEEQSGCLSVIVGFVRALPEQKLARVIAYNKNGEIVDSDWVGRRAIDPDNRNQDRVKNIAQLRAPGIYYVKVEQNPGVRIAEYNQARFLFCHDYCRADIWTNIPGGNSLFRTDEVGYRNPMIEHYYKPFKQAIDVDSISDFMQSDQMMDTHYFTDLLEANDTFDALQVTMGKAVDEENAAEEGVNNDDLNAEISEEQVAMPLLASFIAASIEPVISRIVGNYYYINPANPRSSIAPDDKDTKEKFFPKNGQTDFRVKGYLPFFLEDNLDNLRNRYVNLLARYNVIVNHDDLLPFFDPLSQRNLTPCGLVLAPSLSEKPNPEVLDYNGIVGTTAVPDRNDPDKHELIVNANLIVPTDNSQEAPKPWETIVALSADRKINQGPYQDTSGDDANPLPPGIGILPPVKMVEFNRDNRTYSMTDFFFEAMREDLNTVSYKVVGYDLFGRPSLPKEGGPYDLPIPCFEPQKPLNLHTEIEKIENNVNIYSTFSLLTKDRIIDANSTHLEILIYELPENAPNGVMGTRWNGVRKGVQIRYDINNQRTLDLDSAEKECVELNWELADNPNESDRLESNPIGLNDCAAIFPEGTPFLEPLEALSTADAESLANSNEDIRHYQLRFLIGPKSELGTGEHFYAVVMRVLARCSNTPVASGDIMSGARLFIPFPPPELIQPPLTRVPLSTYPDKNGKSYFQVDLLSCFLPFNDNGQPIGNAPADDSIQLRIYHSTLDKLDKNLKAYVNGDYYVEENGENVLELVRSNATKYELMSAVPISYSSAIRHHKIHVNGNLQKHHVIAVEGVSRQLNAKPWKYCAFFIFKTPTPLLPPAFSQVDTQLYIDDNNESTVELKYIATFPELITGVPPKVQIMRFDLTLGGQSLVAEEIGQLTEELPDRVELPSGVYYTFNIKNIPTAKWHKYRYEATLLYGAALDDTYIKHPEKRDQELTPLPVNDRSPFENTDAEHFVVNGMPIFDFNFAAGEYRLRVKVSFNAESKPIYYYAEIKQGAIYDVSPGLSLELEKDLANNQYKLRVGGNWPSAQKVKLILLLSSSETASKTIEL